MRSRWDLKKEKRYLKDEMLTSWERRIIDYLICSSRKHCQYFKGKLDIFWMYCVQNKTHCVVFWPRGVLLPYECVHVLINSSAATTQNYQRDDLATGFLATSRLVDFKVFCDEILINIIVILMFIKLSLFLDRYSVFYVHSIPTTAFIK